MTSLDVQKVIDEQKVRGPHITLLALCAVIMFLDGFDIFMVGKIAPAIAESYGEPATSLTIVFVLQQIGLTAGAFLISPVSDRHGRKTVLLWSVVAFGLLTLFTVWAQSLLQVAILRGLAGLFLAAVIPNATALLTELAPTHRRASFVSLAFTGYTAGGAAGAFVAIWLLDAYGWESGFWIGGIAPLLVAPLFYFLTHESVQFRTRRNPADPEIARTLRRLQPDLDLAGITHFTIGAAQIGKPKGGLLRVFQDGQAPLTLLLWAIYFMALGTITLLASWMATFFHQLGGISLAKYATVSLISFAGGLAGTMTVGFVMDRFQPTRVLMLLFLVDAVALAAMGSVPFGGGASLILFTVWGYCQAGGQAGINALCAQAYPASIRSTGIGWAFGMGRFGGIFAPVLGGIALSMALDLREVFFLAGLLPLAIIALLFAFERVIVRPQEAATRRAASSAGSTSIAQ
jgi:AAHS family 4-hydroxybenzoate transporter-like MFS transporter